MNRQNLPKGTLKPKSPQYSLTKDEIEELRVAFQLFDTKQEGLIDAKELKTTLESLGIQEKNRMVYNVIDSIPSGKLNFDQFLDMVASRISNTNQEEDIYQVCTKRTYSIPPLLTLLLKTIFILLYFALGFFYIIKWHRLHHN